MPDEEINAVRKIRREISAQYGHNVHEVVAYYRRVQEELKKSGEFHFEETTTVAQFPLPVNSIVKKPVA